MQKRIIYLALILILTIITFSDSFTNGFVTYDDPGYVLDNPFVKNLSFSGIKTIFSQFILGNYHPLTIFSDTILFYFFGANPLPYHALNIILHLLNIVLVFYFIFLLTKNNEIAALVCCFFAIHPVHAETVNWIADLKDLLYTFFYLGALIYYIKYLKSGKNSISHYPLSIVNYILCLVFFIFSLLSKPSAVSLPLVLLLIDFYTDKYSTFNIQHLKLLKKVPFFILSLIFIILTFYGQKSLNAFAEEPTYNFIDRLCLPCYELVYYLFILFIPAGLSVIHPLPVKTNNLLPFIYYISPVILIILTISLFWIIKKYSQYRKIILFGMLFFLITIFPVLQLKLIGFNIVSERYTYLPYIGILFIIAVLFHSLYSSLKIQNSKFKIYRTSYFLLLTSILILFSILTFQRNKVWADSIILYTDVINKNPDNSIVYNNRGNIYANRKKYPEAIADFSEAIALSPGFSDIYYNRGVTYNDLQNYNEAKNDFTKAIDLKPDFAEAYGARGNSFYRSGKYNEALSDYKKFIEFEPNDPSGYLMMGFNYLELKNYQSSLIYFKKAFQIDNSNLYTLFGLVFANIENKDSVEALKYLNIIKEIEPEVVEGIESIPKLEAKGYTWTTNNKNRLDIMFKVLK